MERFAKAVERSWKGWKASRGHVKHVLGSRNAAAASEDVAASEKKVEKRPPPTPKPYALFVKDRFHLVRKQHPLDDFQQTAARLGELWRKMGREEKERYAHLARVGWEKQAAAWFEAHPKRKPNPYAKFVKVGERFYQRTGRIVANASADLASFFVPSFGTSRVRSSSFRDACASGSSLYDRWRCLV